ncbi:YheU family protein [Shewanella sp. C32]|uniref:YheU family protein n=1 Tax=Shewanella electrica TaxID=515560 RepID=A0ABT2FHW0_9GAMM|nr:YheU family protein [Shewanella electrica]MCH1923993.1 YheU family protein [Shewanella electrica]MCS4555896.1 YheU family protein [Shewanella electrica]
MLVPFEALQTLPKETLDNLIREYLFSQVEDGSFVELGDESIQQATAKCMMMLKKKELLVEYSEEDESIAIRSREEIHRRTPMSE